MADTRADLRYRDSRAAQHQKLFCSCESELVEEEKSTLMRRLRPSQSNWAIEPGGVGTGRQEDELQVPGATVEMLLGRGKRGAPHDADEDAVRAFDSISPAQGKGRRSALHAEDRHRRVEASGFQRTALISTGGVLDLNGRSISILSNPWRRMRRARSKQRTVRSLIALTGWAYP